ncbi:MAG: alpha hydrolase, partial [Candidatus Hydrothermarchaeales archaeon]
MSKAEILLDWFKDKESAAVAFSGGVDSAVVAAAAHRTLGEKAVSVTARSSTISEKELAGA